MGRKTKAIDSVHILLEFEGGDEVVSQYAGISGYTPKEVDKQLNMRTAFHFAMHAIDNDWPYVVMRRTLELDLDVCEACPVCGGQVYTNPKLGQEEIEDLAVQLAEEYGSTGFKVKIIHFTDGARCDREMEAWAAQTAEDVTEGVKSEAQQAPATIESLEEKEVRRDGVGVSEYHPNVLTGFVPKVVKGPVITQCGRSGHLETTETRPGVTVSRWVEDELVALPLGGE